MAQRTTDVWVWCPTEETKDRSQMHPADLPENDEALAKRMFIDKVRGPRMSRISIAQQVCLKGDSVLIAENGATREVSRSFLLPWYEGLLLLQEIEHSKGKKGQMPASWFSAELQQKLAEERHKRGHLLASLWAVQKLQNAAITGREFNYRRDNLSDTNPAADSEARVGLCKVADIAAYRPAWEAFLDERCGLYQDFYLVRWGPPFSEIDYAKVENGCATMQGATWEPDECLPVHLDFLRLKAKGEWLKKKRMQEEQERAMANVSIPRAVSSTDKAAAVRPEKVPVVPKESAADRRPPPSRLPPRKMARLRRDGAPLARDKCYTSIGHDFVPTTSLETSNLRHGWPKDARDYPPGFAVAGPPGFCRGNCDCMDDARPQKPWETMKEWLEDGDRTKRALAAIEGLAAQTSFVTQRGKVSMQCLFETAQTVLGDQVYRRAAHDLMIEVQKALREAVKAIPASSLAAEGGNAVHLPAAAFLSGEHDYSPLRFQFDEASSGSSLPPWLCLGADDGRLALTAGSLPVLKDKVALRLDLLSLEGKSGCMNFAIAPDLHGGLTAPWSAYTAKIMEKFNSPHCQLLEGVRGALSEHLAPVFDFARRTPKDTSLGLWIRIMSRILRMLRSAMVANIAPSRVQRKVVTGQSPPLAARV